MTNSYMFIMLIILLLIVIILLMPLKVQIIRNNNKNDINIYLVKIFNIRLDLDEFLKKVFLKTDKTTINDILDRILEIKIYHPFIKRIMRIIVIKKSTICYKVNSIFTAVGSWNSIFLFRNFLITNFLDAEREYYNVNYDETDKSKVNFEFVFFIRGIYLLYAYIISVKEIKKNKRKGSVVSVRASNK